MTRRAAVLLFLVFLITAFVLTHLPGGSVPKVGWLDSIPNADKMVHAGLYFCLAAFLANCLRFRVKSNRVIVAVTMSVLAGYAAFDEWSQQLSPHRYPDFYDFVADIIGAWFGASTFVVWRWCRHHLTPRTVESVGLEPKQVQSIRPANGSTESGSTKVHSPA